jgi:methylenetetrahydrofolate dehydrogenase (NADP+) / methenyltetrahydrofolate cyclohydrolase
MPATILDGRSLAAELRLDIVGRSEALRARNIHPHLVVAIAGDGAASKTYVQSLVREGQRTGIAVTVDAVDAAAGTNDVRALLERLGEDPSVHGIILQQPLPAHLDIRSIAGAMPPDKDVDAASPLNLGRLAFSDGTEFIPATPAAVMALLERSSRWPLNGVRACMVGRSSVVGLPVSLLMLRANATVTIAHAYTADLLRHTRDAEVLVVATGIPGLIRAEMVMPGATVIDVGTTYVDGKLVGDVAYAEVAEVAGEITPVPGGVGPVTNVTLMRNVVLAAERLSPA